MKSFPRISNVEIAGLYKLKILFDTQEYRIFDITKYINIGVFKELKDEFYFKKVFVEDGTIRWPNGQDFCPDTIYSESRGKNNYA